MPWGRIDDTFHSHPKVVTMPAEIRMAAVGLFWMGVSWSNAHSTDGRIPAGVTEVLGGTQEQASALVRARLWHRRGRGFEIHDFLEFNASAAETRERSGLRSRAGRLGALKRWQTDGTLPSADGKPIAPAMPLPYGSDGKPMAPANGTAIANDAPVPSRPVPITREETPPPPTSGGRRKDRTNPRAAGTSPRQEGENPRRRGTSIRAQRDEQKRGPTKLGDLFAQVLADKAGARAPVEPMPANADASADAPGESWFEPAGKAGGAG